MSTLRQYELVYIVSPSATDEVVAELHTQVEAIVGKFDGRIEKTENWGKRRLAYEVNHYKEGTYVLELLSGSGEMVGGRRAPYHYEQVFEWFPRLKERARQKAGTLSGGEQQMLAMARALMSRPSLLLMDEPSMGLSPLFVQQTFDIIREISRQGTTIFVVEQNANMALSIADRGYVLQTGKIVLADTAANLRENKMMRQAYLGET